MAEGKLITGADDDVALSKKVSKDANRYESAKMHHGLTSGQEVETEKKN